MVQWMPTVSSSHFVRTTFIRMKLEPTILYEDRHVLVVNKPAGWVTMGLPEGQETLLTWLKRMIKERDSKPGNVFLGIVSRLDTPVTGAVLLAKTSKAAARLAEQFRQRTVSKIYWAIVEGKWPKPEGTLLHWIKHDPRFRRVHITHAKDPDAEEAVLSYRLLEASPQCSLLELAPQTGRKHQIRIQLSSCGHPILGDRKYGAKNLFPTGIALHAKQITFLHPVEKTPKTVEAPLPPYWRSIALKVLSADRT
ncbi:tRNA pseudouridine synthase C, group TruC1-like protein [Thermogutta terrifontis]|uniref:tRNA pseudouridine synthase C, group TruC1-like protein n=1 Tax=Thermogutta terrifontis TaxID=1331910 RepID=A0A286RH87_9BACT|nr:RluA family pseudouridine synthase [Thermogutta terrifontis]ASV75296.1 tRNA pseudouridine synthase C, group TruC1-like protein [Thermogutta terrifontis]